MFRQMATVIFFINRPFAAKPSRDLLFIKLWATTLRMLEMEKACWKHQNGQVWSPWQNEIYDGLNFKKAKICIENVAEDKALLSSIIFHTYSKFSKISKWHIHYTYTGEN